MKKKKKTNLPVKTKSTELITVDQEKSKTKSSPLEINSTEKWMAIRWFP